MQGGLIMRQAWILIAVFAMMLIFCACGTKEDISNVTKYKSPDHKAIYTKLEKSREAFNKRKDMDLSSFTDNARIMTRKGEEKIVVSPEELVKHWPNRIEVFKKHKLFLRTIEVKDLQIKGDTAYLTSTRTYYSRRWNKYTDIRFNKTYKKVDGEWKLHKLTFKEL
jgi:hypothetical protein